MRNTPVRNGIGDFIDDWRGEGSVEVDIELGIPLNNPQLQTQVHVNVLCDRSTLTIPEYALSISELRGRVAFDSDIGLTANALVADFLTFRLLLLPEPLRLLTAEKLLVRVLSVAAGPQSRRFRPGRVSRSLSGMC